MAKKPHLDLFAIGEHGDFTKTVTEYDVYAFAGIVGDFYGIHVDEEYAKKTPFRKRITQGALSIGFVATVMGKMASRVPPPGAVSYRYDISFTAPAFFGDTLTAKLVLREKNEDDNLCIFDASVTNQNGQSVAGGTTYLKVL